VIKPRGWDEFVSTITSGRPWVDDDSSRNILEVVGQEDIARVVSSFFRGGAMVFLTQPNRDLGGGVPVDLLRTEEGAYRVRQFLMCNPWL
jgi:hypothetical protein